MQYFIRPIQTFDEFCDQVVGLVETAADYDARLVVFPEYFTLQLLTLNDVKRPLPEQIRDLAEQEPAFLQLMTELATQHKQYIVAGTIPHLNDDGAVNNVCHVGHCHQMAEVRRIVEGVPVAHFDSRNANGHAILLVLCIQ